MADHLSWGCMPPANNVHVLCWRVRDHTAGACVELIEHECAGLDARAAAIVMRCVKSIADTGRTIGELKPARFSCSALTLLAAVNLLLYGHLSCSGQWLVKLAAVVIPCLSASHCAMSDGTCT